MSARGRHVDYLQRAGSDRHDVGYGRTAEEGRPLVVESITTVDVHDERQRPGVWPLCPWAGVSAMGKALRKRGSPWGPGCGEIRGGKGGKKRRKKKGRRGKAVEPLSISSRND